jgi:hypothetical protein
MDDIKENCLNKSYWVIRNLLENYNRIARTTH